MMTQHSLTTRLGEYISLVLPDAPGHQQKAVTDFVLAVVMVHSCCQPRLARFFDNFEAASKRLSRFRHNARGWRPRSWLALTPARSSRVFCARPRPGAAGTRLDD